MTAKRLILCLVPLLAGWVGACSTAFSSAIDTATGRQHIYVMSRETALGIAHDAIAESFPDNTIVPTEPPTLGFFARTYSGLDTSTEQVVVHPVAGVTASGATIDGYTFEVSGRGPIGAGDLKTASFYARLQQALDATGDATDVVRIEPRAAAP
jgi:hypothetical protein